MGKIRSINAGYITMGLAPLPRAEQTFIVVRDNHGVQLVNLETQKSHQLILSRSDDENAFSDLKFLAVWCEEGKGGAAYSLATIFEEMSRDVDKKQEDAKLCLYTLSPEFTNGLKSYSNNIIH